MKHLDLFSGLGLFSYAADRVWDDLIEHIFCEIEEWPYRFLKQEYPNARIERDIRNFDGTEHAGGTFLLTAGVPCQPASVAGKRKGTEDDRWLWPEALRVLFESQAECAIFENPIGILTLEKGLVFENLLLEMESQGYEVQPYIIPACAIGAIHRRDRVWIVANSKNTNNRKQSRKIDRTRENGQYRQKMGIKFKRQNSDATDPDRLNGNDAGHGSGEICGELWKEAEIQGCEDVANSMFSGQSGSGKHRASGDSKKNKNREINRTFNDNQFQRPWPEVATELCGVDVQTTDRVHRLKALGNTIQWEVAVAIMQRIKENNEN